MSPDTDPQLAYYRDRALEYESVYAKPERQPELALLRDWVTQRTRNRRVLEIACGTGYWTAVAASSAARIAATDSNDTVLDVARHKHLPPSVTLERRDAYTLGTFAKPFDCVMAFFWWSHIPRTRLSDFLAEIRRVCSPGARCLFADNRYVEGSSTPILRTDLEGNSYQRRTLADGSQHEVLKNFPDAASVNAAISAVARVVEFRELKYYWTLEAEFNL